MLRSTNKRAERARVSERRKVTLGWAQRKASDRDVREREQRREKERKKGKFSSVCYSHPSR